jgi:predicted RNA binding protein YcfA (HicA-like mRNA interferase family)
LGKLKVVSSLELIKLLNKIGFEKDHQTGSHIILRNINYPFRRISVPNHKEFAKGTLRSIIKECGLSLVEFNEL